MLQWALLLAAVLARAETWEAFFSRPGGVPTVEARGEPGSRLILETTDDFHHWQETARVFDRLWPYADFLREGRASGFYRVRSAAAVATDDWANQIVAGNARLFRPGTGSGLAATASLKWSILLSQPDRVYFQDSVAYPYHIQFARARLPGYAGMGAVAFNAQALYANADQRMVLGSVFRAPEAQVRELGIEITGADAFPAAMAATWVDSTRRRLVSGEGWRVYYMPSSEQQAETDAHLPLFAAKGIEVSSLNRWASANTCYSAGWALGRLVFVPAAEISEALGDGRLRFGDILVTDRVPAELPILAGYLCLEPATPNSHVALLARSLLIPFAHAAGAGLQAEIAALSGREVLVIVEEANGSCRISLQDTTGLLTPERRQEILASKAGGPLDFPAREIFGSFTVPADLLTPAEMKYVGGKAANFGFLRRSLPDDSPHPALAITFDLWEAYLGQTLPGGATLRQFIAERLAAHTYPPDIPSLRSDLDAIRTAVEKTADFTSAQRTAIVSTLQSAGLQGANIRFRSSTNVEDGESFNGAGLYDSYSGCLEDDVDADTAGPSLCDPTETKERGVFRAMRKVYASFYNENAVLERLRHGVDEEKAGMAMLVHFSTPDALEMANGVATLAVTDAPATRSVTVRLVAQLGAESITNPDVSVRPEVVTASFAGVDPASASLSLAEASSLTPESTVMTWQTDYRALLAQLNTAARAYEAYFPAKAAYELDFEFKKLQPGEVGVKQMRAVPHPVPVPPPTIP